MELLPNSLSFRVVTTIDVESDADIPADFSGRVRHLRDGAVVAISWFEHGVLENPARRVPAHVRLRPDGKVKQERHYRLGRLHDPEPGRPAVRGFYANGATKYAEHFRYGRRQDGPDGSPAIVKWRLDGSVRSEVRYPAQW